MAFTRCLELPFYILHNRTNHQEDHATPLTAMGGMEGRGL